jgi:hypothetical protein
MAASFFLSLNVYYAFIENKCPDGTMICQQPGWRLTQALLIVETMEVAGRTCEETLGNDSIVASLWGLRPIFTSLLRIRFAQ